MEKENIVHFGSKRHGTMPAVSVCIPAYKAPAYFKRAIESVAKQDYPDFEVVVTDDSPDNCIQDILRQVNLPMPLIYEKNPERLGSPGNWNRAMGLAAGRFIKILHHDDWFLTPRSLTRFVELMEKLPQAALGFSAAEAYDQEGGLKFVHKPSGRRLNDLDRDCNALFSGNLIGPPSSTIFRNNAGLRFDEKLRWLVDVDFYIRLLQGGGAFAYCENALIGVTCQSAHQVTRECEKNKQVQLFEHLYLFSKIKRKTTGFCSQLKIFLQLFERFSICSSRDLGLLAPDVKIPWYLKALANAPRFTHNKREG